MSAQMQSKLPDPQQQPLDNSRLLVYKLRDNETYHSDKVIYEQDDNQGARLKINVNDFGSGAPCKKHIGNLQSR